MAISRVISIKLFLFSNGSEQDDDEIWVKDFPDVS